MPLSRQVKAVISNQIGFPVPAINVPDPLELVPPLDDVYEGTTFSFDVSYVLYEVVSEVETEYAANTSIALTSYSSGEIGGMSAAKINQNTVRISGSPSNVFTDAYYKFLMEDGTVQTLPADTEGYLTVIEWSIPTTKIKPITHTVQVQITDTQLNENGSFTSTHTHDVYWKLEPALAQFRDLLAKGKI